MANHGALISVVPHPIRHHSPVWNAELFSIRTNWSPLIWLANLIKSWLADLVALLVASCYHGNTMGRNLWPSSIAGNARRSRDEGENWISGACNNINSHSVRDCTPKEGFPSADRRGFHVWSPSRSRRLVWWWVGKRMAIVPNLLVPQSTLIPPTNSHFIFSSFVPCLK